MMSNIGYISCTRKPTQPLHYECSEWTKLDHAVVIAVAVSVRQWRRRRLRVRQGRRRSFRALFLI